MAISFTVAESQSIKNMSLIVREYALRVISRLKLNAKLKLYTSFFEITLHPDKHYINYFCIMYLLQQAFSLMAL